MQSSTWSVCSRRRDFAFDCCRRCRCRCHCTTSNTKPNIKVIKKRQTTAKNVNDIFKKNLSILHIYDRSFYDLATWINALRILFKWISKKGTLIMWKIRVVSLKSRFSVCVVAVVFVHANQFQKHSVSGLSHDRKFIWIELNGDFVACFGCVSVNEIVELNWICNALAKLNWFRFVWPSNFVSEVPSQPSF